MGRHNHCTFVGFHQGWERPSYFELLHLCAFLTGIRTSDHSVELIFGQWGQDIISSCSISLRPQIQKQLTLLLTALDNLAGIFMVDIPSLMPRPALLLMGYTASSLYLLEHAIWSFTNAESPVDVEVFRRWAEEGGLTEAIEGVQRAKEGTDQRELANSAIAFGGPIKPRL
jgi:hypothetical protein